MVNNHKAVNVLCEILDRSPVEHQHDLIFFACYSVGLSMKPTGLKPTKERTIKQLHWDFAVDDLRKRLVQLVDEIGVLEQVVVEGVLAYLISFYRNQADPNGTPRVIQRHIDMIENMKQELCLSVSERETKMSDDELKESITFFEDMLSGCEARRQNSEEALHFLQQEVKDTFTDGFWEGVN